MGSRSNETPSVSAWLEKAAEIRLARPYPVDAPITSTFFGPFPCGKEILEAISTCCRIFSMQPAGWEVMHTNPLILGFIIIILD